MCKIAFVFPGQGSQYVGMGKNLSQDFASVRQVFQEADEKLEFALSELCFEGPEEELKLTVNTQPAILTTSIAILKTLEKEGIKPDYVAGHSLGEYSALVAAGAIETGDAVQLVRQRGTYMQEAVPPGQGTMAAVLGLEINEVQNLCRAASSAGVIEAANYNCPGQVVVAGATPAVEKCVEIAKSFGAKRAMILSVSGPFHSSMLKPASERLAVALGNVRISNAAIPVMANYTANLETTAPIIKENLINQVSAPVLWQQSVENLIALGVDTFVEIGPGKVLSGLVKKIDKNVRMYNIEDRASLEETLESLARKQA